MMNTYNQLEEVLKKSILAIDTYIEKINQFIHLLEAKSELDNHYNEVPNLIIQNQSLLSALFIIKDINVKKINRLKTILKKQRQLSSSEKLNESKIDLRKDYSRSLNKRIRIKLKLDNYKGLGKDKLVILNLDLKDYWNILNQNPSLNLKIKYQVYEKNKNKFYTKVHQIKINLRAPMKG